MTSTINASDQERLLLHGIADLAALSMTGSRAAEFAGTPVRAIKEGRVVALVSMAPQPMRLPRWLDWMVQACAPDMTPVDSALSSLIPILPVAPGTTFESEESLRQMLLARESELASFVADHGNYLECEVTAGFDSGVAEKDISNAGPIARLRAETETERALIEQQLGQSVAGRRATFLARLHRRIVDHAIDILSTGASNESEGLRRRILIARQNREPFRSSLRLLLDEVGAGAWLNVGPFMPADSFRRLEISSADVARVSEARAALGLQETTERQSIRVAYDRTVERFCARSARDEVGPRLARLESLFGLLNSVAEGQIRASHDEATLIRLDPDALKRTWLLNFHKHDRAERAA